VLWSSVYKEVNLTTVIKLLLRCKKLYQAFFEIKKLIQLVIKQEDVFSPTGLIYSCMNKYAFVKNIELTDQDEAVLMRGF